MLSEQGAEAFKLRQIEGLRVHLGSAAATAIDLRAGNLFEGVDTDNPTLVTTAGDFEIAASSGPEGSTYLDLGEGAEFFVFADSLSGEQVAYRVEDGALGDRIESGEGGAPFGQVSVSFGESSAGDPQIAFRTRAPNNGGWFPIFSTTSTLTLNSDSSMLAVRSREGGFNFFNRNDTTYDSFDIQSGAQLVTAGEVDVAAMTQQQQFDFYAGTPQGARILQVEGNFYDRPVEQRLFVARVQYMRGEGGAEVFNEFTPRRATLSGDDLAAYDAEVQDMMAEIRAQGVYTQGVDGTDDVADLDAPVDESMLYILASSAVEAYGESPAALDAISGDIGTWKISTDNADGISIVTDTRTAFSAGWYNGGSGTVQFNIDSLVNDYVQPDDAFELVTHELAHSLDNVEQDRPGVLDGIPPGLSADETATLIAERERLFELAYPGEDADSSVNQDYNTVAENSGFRNYTFYNRKEFWAELSATFLGSAAGAEVVRDASPELYNMLRVYYGRDDLPPA